MTTVQLLEFLKYFTLKGRPIGFDNKFGQFVDYVTKEENIKTPEGYEFTIRQFRVNWGEVLGNPKSDEFCEKYFCFDLRNNNFWISPNPENHIRQINAKPFSSGGDQYVRYLFYSNRYYSEMEKNPEWHMETVNQYDNILWINEMGESLYPLSLIISIKADRQTDFDDFLKLNFTNWKNSFQAAITEATKESAWQRDFSNLIKYPTKVFQDALLYTDRIKLIEILAYTEMWDWLIGTDEVNEQEFTLQLIETTPENEAYSLYQKMFDESAKLFKALDGRFDDSHNLKFVLFLVKALYSYKKGLGGNVLEDFISVIPENHIIPIRALRLKPSLNMYGPNPVFEFLPNKVKLDRIDFYIGSGLNIRNYNALNPDPFAYLYKEYPYEEMLKVFIWRENAELGLAQGRIIPLPVFAIKAFHKGISDDVTIIDFISKLVEIAGIILPYMKLLEIVEMGALWYEADLLATSVATTNAFGGMYISYLEPELRKNQAGINFLRAYNYLSFIYGAKDLAKKEFWVAITDKIRQKDPFAISDAENFMTLWSTFINTPEFNPQAFENKPLMNEIKQISLSLKYKDK